jgi:hypothetical protein
MSKPATHIGIIAGLIATPFLVFPVLKLFLGHCFFEQGCEPHEDLKVLGAVLAACALGAAIAWIVGWLISFALDRHRPMPKD